MSSQTAHKTIKQLKSRLEEKNERLNHLLAERKQVHEYQSSLEEKVFEKKEQSLQLRQEIEGLKQHIHEQELSWLADLQRQQGNKEKEKQALEDQIQAVKGYRETFEKKEKAFQEKQKEEQELNALHKQLVSAKQGLTQRNYQLYMDRGGEVYPVNGTDREKKEWLSKFGRFVEALRKL